MNTRSDIFAILEEKNISFRTLAEENKINKNNFYMILGGHYTSHKVEAILEDVLQCPIDKLITAYKTEPITYSQYIARKNPKQQKQIKRMPASHWGTGCKRTTKPPINPSLVRLLVHKSAPLLTVRHTTNRITEEQDRKRRMYEVSRYVKANWRLGTIASHLRVHISSVFNVVQDNPEFRKANPNKLTSDWQLFPSGE